MRILITTLVLACLLPLAAQAAIIDVYVTSSNNSGPNTLRQAIIDANANDLNNDGTTIHIQLANGNPIELTSDLPFITARVITIAGDPAYRPLIDGQGSYRLFYFRNASILVAVRNLDLQFGRSDLGGCIRSSVSGSLSIINVSFFACEARAASDAFGGAIFSSGTLQVSQSLFVSNYANADVKAYGGAIFMNAPNTSLTITDSHFIGNKAVGVDATAVTKGGAIRAGTDVDVAIEHSSFVGNKALTPAHPGFSSGGAIAGLANHLQITRSSLVSNHADLGGAISYFQVAAPTETNIDIRNTSFILNKATTGNGGAIYTARAMLKLRNNSFWHNSAVQLGNNLADANGSVLAYVWNNLFTLGDGSITSCQAFATPTSSGYNVLPNANCGLGAGPGDQITTGLGIIGLKLDSFDVASVWMVQDSPAVEGGNPGAVDDDMPEACLELDAPGNTRPALGVGVDGNGPPVMAHCDIGAWESPGEAPLFYGSFDDPLLGYE